MVDDHVSIGDTISPAKFSSSTKCRRIRVKIREGYNRDARVRIRDETLSFDGKR